MCVLFPVSFVHTTYLIPQREEEREENPFILSLVKFLDLLLTTFRLLGREVVTGGEKKDLYTVYKYICKLYSSFVQALALLFAPSFPFPSLES